MTAPAAYAARWVLPVSAPPIAHGAVAVDADGRIAYVGPRGGAPAPTHDLGDAVLAPGLVNAHAHLDPADPGGGVAAALASGVTTLAAAAADPAPIVDALAAAGMRGVVHQELTGAHPSERAAALSELQARVIALRTRVAATAGRVRVGVGPRDAVAVHEDLLLDACAWAVAERLPLAVRAGETPDEAAFLRDAAGPAAEALRARGLAVHRRAHSAVHLLAELGIAAVARPLLVHGTEFDASDVALAAYYDCPVAVCPAAGAASLRALLEAGVRVALGTGRPAGLPPPKALRLATLGGACALDLADQIGSLDLGKHADLAAFRLAAPDGDPFAAVLAAQATGPALLVTVSGQVIAGPG